uniref:Uncharacterized protein n=1 Tax=Triticum urartu TaxID=4572 RepID=A0A8R7VJ02_TRIUA
MCVRERGGKEGDWNKWRRKLLVDFLSKKSKYQPCYTFSVFLGSICI